MASFALHSLAEVGPLVNVSPYYLTCGPLLMLLGWIVYCRTLHPLAAIPGPILGSFSFLWLLHANRRADLHERIQRLHDKYGPVVRVRNDEVWVDDVEKISAIYGRYTKLLYREVLFVERADLHLRCWERCDER